MLRTQCMDGVTLSREAVDSRGPRTRKELLKKSSDPPCSSSSARKSSKMHCRHDEAGHTFHYYRVWSLDNPRMVARPVELVMSWIDSHLLSLFVCNRDRHYAYSFSLQKSKRMDLIKTSKCGSQTCSQQRQDPPPEGRPRHYLPRGSFPRPGVNRLVLPPV